MSEMELPLSAALRVATALWRARGEHVARLVDVLGVPGGGVRLVIDDGAFPLADMLARGLTLGEAVTVLVPLAECVESLGHRAVEHGAVGVDAVRLDGRGTPVLGSFDAARALEDRTGWSDRAPIGVSPADREAYRTLSRAVLAAVGGADPAVLGSLESAAEALDVRGSGSLSAFAERLLVNARPEPVRIGLTLAVHAEQDAAPAAHGLPASGSVRGRLARLRAGLAGVRPKFWLPAAAVAVTLLAAVLLVPTGASDAQDGAVPGAATSSRPTTRPTPARTARADATPTPPADPVAAVLALREDASGARVLDDYGDVVLLEIDTARGAERLLLERTDLGWRLRGTLPTGPGGEAPNPVRSRDPRRSSRPRDGP